VVQPLRKRGLIEPAGTERPGRLPERTIYQLTDAGRVEAGDWLADLISAPAAEISFVQSLIRDIEADTLDGVDWWRQAHERSFDQVPPPFDPQPVSGTPAAQY